MSSAQTKRADHSTPMLEKSWTTTCTCGSEECRKAIADFITLPAGILLGRSVVQHFILKAMAMHERE